MKNVTIPSQFLQELLALCGPEDHELRERVLKSAAPAHPAEGVPAQANRDAVIQHLTNAGVLEHDGCGVFIASGDASELIDACMTLPLSTHPTQQGLDAQRWQIVHNRISGEYIAGRACFVVQIAPVPGVSIMRGSVAEHFIRAVDFAAAQAKQGAQA